MPSLLTVDDFKPVTLTSELRYNNAYLVFDRTGHVLEDLRDSFTDMSAVVGTPQQTTFTSAQGTLSLEMGACRFTSSELDKGPESFARHSKIFFDTVAQHLRIRAFTRIGLRYILKKEFKTEDESKSALASMMLANLKPTRRFNSSDSPTEVMFRWEDAQIGATVRLKAETIEIKTNVPPELKWQMPKTDKKVIVLTLDIDYYTVALVEREQWDAQEWLLQKFRTIKKEVDDILRGGGR